MDNPDDPHMFIPPTGPSSTHQSLNKSRRWFHPGRLILWLLAIAVIFAAGLFTGSRQANTGTALQASNTHSSASSANDPAAAREQVIAQVRPSVVEINVGKGNSGSSLGSGVVLDSKGYIITNNHVVEGAQSIEVVFANGTTLPGQLTGTAPTDDLAVVKVDASKVKLTVISLGDSSKVQVG